MVIHSRCDPENELQTPITDTHISTKVLIMTKRLVTEGLT